MHKRLQKPILILVPKILGLSILLSGCSTNENHNRGYVISQSQIENEAEASATEESLHQSQ